MRRYSTWIGAGAVLLGMAIYGAAPAAGADLEKGKKVYEEKKCGLCHAIGGKGGKTGPDLSDVGGRRDGEWLAKFLKDPKGTVPGSKHMAVQATEEEFSDLAAYLLSLKK